MKSFGYIFALALVLGTGADPLGRSEAPALFTIEEGDTGDIIECLEEDVLSCQKININFDLLRDGVKEIQFLDGLVLKEDTQVPVSSVTEAVNFENAEGSSAVLVWTIATEISSPEVSCEIDIVGNDKENRKGRLFFIENCGDNCHVLIEEPTKKRDGVPESRPTQQGSSRSQFTAPEEAVANRAGIYELGVMFWYTPDFKKVTSNIESEMNLLIAASNLALKKSGVNFRIKATCFQELVGFSETGDPLGNFATPSKRVERRNKADATILMLSKPKCDDSGCLCGVAYFDLLDQVGYDGIQSFGLVMKGCKGDTLGHELAHMYGADHNREIVNDPQGTAYGKLVNKPDGSPSGFHTVMAYNRENYMNSIGCYSSPDVVCKGYTTGDAQNNVVKLLNDRAAKMSTIGDESGTCSGISPSGTPPAALTTKAPTVTDSPTKAPTTAAPTKAPTKAPTTAGPEGSGDDNGWEWESSGWE